jgi:hypothetical protein
MNQMENVVYLLGAGFSAPLGLPVMSNFMQRSKDLYFKDPERYKHFEGVFREIREMQVCKSYFHADLFNIEEILSIFEMTNTLRKKRKKNAFTNYILDVIEGYTPEVNMSKTRDFSYSIQIDDSVDPIDLHQRYGHFVASLFNITNYGKRIKPGDEVPFSYSVVSLNYDMVLENFRRSFQETHEVNEAIRFGKEWEENATNGTVFLSKLHGSVDTQNIIPPTWNKGVNEHIRQAWQLAYNVLSEANHIRIIGYSLPITDAYIKYLLKSSIIKNQNLKSLDVLCADSDGQVQTRYKDWICFPKYRFKNGKVEDYLNGHLDLTENNHLRTARFERDHERFFNSEAK